MNRKMRAKLANAEAKKRRTQPRCSQEGAFMPDEGQTHCDECGVELTPVALVAVVDDTPCNIDKRRLN